ncbi:MAG: hypothetical protein HYY37_00710 [Candidatus Aenigmarchaeota archaeon]|nr:hypothetical protein [Candidatus Aenigmarchaeota archaeon]
MKKKGQDFGSFVIILVVMAVLLLVVLASLNLWNCHTAPGDMVRHCHSLFTPAHTH